MNENPSDRAPLEVILDGSNVGHGELDVDVLLPFLDHFRRALRAVARTRRGLPPVQSGHPTTEIAEATSLRLVGIAPGSTQLLFAPTDANLFGGEALETVDELISQLLENRLADPVIESEMLEACRALGDNGSIQIEARGRAARFDSSQVRQTGVEPSPVGGTTVAVDGWLHLADLATGEIKIRDVQGEEWTGRYDADLEPVVLALLGRSIRARGEIEKAPRRVAIAELSPAGPPRGAMLATHRRSAAEVISTAAAAQGVTSPQPLDVLRADVDPNDELEIAFEAALRAAG
ncbi:MAG TPA: hypothetical protein VF183_03670 [Acidimicrobiales bacterium]